MHYDIDDIDVTFIRKLVWVFYVLFLLDVQYLFILF